MNAMYLISLLQLLPMGSNPGGTVSLGYSFQGMTNVGTIIIRTGLSEMLIQAMGTHGIKNSLWMIILLEKEKCSSTEIKFFKAR